MNRRWRPFQVPWARAGPPVLIRASDPVLHQYRQQQLAGSWRCRACQQYTQEVQAALARQAERHCEVVPAGWPAPATSTWSRARTSAGPFAAAAEGGASASWRTDACLRACAPAPQRARMAAGGRRCWRALAPQWSQASPQKGRARARTRTSLSGLLRGLLAVRVSRAEQMPCVCHRCHASAWN